MGRRLQVNGEEAEYPEDTEIRELKQESGLPEDDIVVYNDGGGDGWTPVSDRDTVKEVPEGSAVNSQPAKGTLFG